MNSESEKFVRKNMKVLHIFVLLLVLLPCLSAMADYVTLSARWDGSEDMIAAYPGTCNGAGSLGYRQFSAIQVSKSGQYHLADASDNLPGDVMIAIYEGHFNPADPAANLVSTIDEGGFVGLASGMDYIVVAQHWCTNTFPATFGISFSGPGDISGAEVVVSPDWTHGKLDGVGPRAVFSGVSQNYVVSDNLSVPETGLYHFADVSLHGRLDTEVRVYKDSFNPADTSEGLIARLDDSGNVSLVSGSSYLLVVTANTPGNGGDWHWVLFPPGPLQLNAGLNGHWYDPATSGQGLLVDIMPQIQLVFVAWFTYDLQRPDGAAEAMIGDEGHRWFTAYGNYTEGDNLVSLEIQNTTGGVFDSADPPVMRDSEYGTIELEFTDCLKGKMTYHIPSGPVDAEIPISRIVNDHLPLCANLGSSGPGVITD